MIKYNCIGKIRNKVNTVCKKEKVDDCELTTMTNMSLENNIISDIWEAKLYIDETLKNEEVKLSLFDEEETAYEENKEDNAKQIMNETKNMTLEKSIYDKVEENIKKITF